MIDFLEIRNKLKDYYKQKYDKFTKRLKELQQKYKRVGDLISKLLIENSLLVRENQSLKQEIINLKVSAKILQYQNLLILELIKQFNVIQQIILYALKLIYYNVRDN
ncbi:unnamed protein product [Paramecium sonneborni]|uniref:Uncharacterized protein n=1 Tax=Paramecium sonneborni TaxID=65129 RepID=A0A8S1MM10_9CILI|nr:unnamed protein product [Paramecium sonneborni]